MKRIKVIDNHAVPDSIDCECGGITRRVQSSSRVYVCPNCYGITVVDPRSLTHVQETASRRIEAFTEAEYRVDPRSVITHAIATGCAVVVREDGSPRVVISVPPADAKESR